MRTALIVLAATAAVCATAALTADNAAVQRTVADIVAKGKQQQQQQDQRASSTHTNDDEAGSVPIAQRMTGRRLGGGLKPRPASEKTFVVTSPMPHTYIAPSAIPRDHTWANKSGINYLTESRNQHIPSYCGSCWAMASTSSIADRIRIMRNGSAPDYLIAVQTIVYCVPHGCWGGDPDDVHAYIYNNDIGPDSCQNYVAQGSGGECAPARRCENCIGVPDVTNCHPITKFPKFGVAEYGNVLGVEQMKAEIFARGPIACGVDSSPLDAFGYGPNRSTVFTGGAGMLAIDHEIAVVGFGYDPTQQVDYWVIRNSWGEFWGVDGYFRLKMGDNQLNIEGAPCAWAVPKLPRM